MTSPPARQLDERLASLIEAACGGDKDALNEIVRELTPMLWHVARAHGADRESAADVVQHTWLTLINHLDGIRTPAALIGWLVTVTKREAWRVAKSTRGEQLVEGDAFALTPDSSLGPEDQAVLRDLWTAVRQLSERCQQLLRIVAFVHRPDYGQLSAELGVPRGTIGPTRGRCLAQLRKLIGGDDG